MQRGPSSNNFLEGGSEDSLKDILAPDPQLMAQQSPQVEKEQSMLFNKEIVSQSDNLFNVSKKPPSAMNKSNSALGSLFPRRMQSPAGSNIENEIDPNIALTPRHVSNE